MERNSPWGEYNLQVACPTRRKNNCVNVLKDILLNVPRTVYETTASRTFDVAIGRYTSELLDDEASEGNARSKDKRLSWLESDTLYQEPKPNIKVSNFRG